jgi:autotransporter passenger strand-loop-strand repeat protein
LDVLPGGAASDTVVDNGGTENVAGSDVAATVNDGGYQYVLAGSTATNAVVNDAGVQIVLSGGTTTDTTLSGGIQGVYGTAVGTVVGSGGFEEVFSGGVGGDTTIDSGTLELANGGSAGTGPITFEGSGDTLTIDGTLLPANVISGFGSNDTIDLSGVSLDGGGGVTLEANNVVQIVASSQTYLLNFDPVQSFLPEAFQLSPDPNGGTTFFWRKLPASCRDRPPQMPQ